MQSTPRPYIERSPTLQATLAVLAMLAAAAPAAAQDGAASGHRSRRHGREAAPADAPATTPPAAQPVEQPSTTAPVAQAAAPVEASSAQDSAPAEAAAASEAPAAEGEASEGSEARTLRLSFTGGLGRVSEAEANDAANFAEGALRVAYIGVEDLEVALDGSLQFYDRAYQTTLPGSADQSALRVSVAETRLRAGLTGGYNVLGPAGVERDLAQVAPYLRFELDQYRNDVVPETVLGLGLGVNAAVRIADGLHLEGGVAYSYAVSAGPSDVAARLAFGTVLGELRYRGGIAIALPPRARLRLSYEGESVALEHSNRFQNSLSLGLDVDL